MDVRVCACWCCIDAYTRVGNYKFRKKDNIYRTAFTGGCHDCGNARSSTAHRSPHKRLASSDGKQHRATWYRRGRNCSKQPSKTHHYPDWWQNKKQIKLVQLPTSWKCEKGAYLSSLTIVRLSMSITSGVTPVTVAAHAGWSNLGAGSRPEPSVQVSWQQVGTVAALEVALATRCPDVADIAACDTLLDELVLLWCLQGDGVHAVSAADVSCVQPADLQVASWCMLPTEEVWVSNTTGVSVVGVTDTYSLSRWELVYLFEWKGHF